jgi:hypothetical protein
MYSYGYHYKSKSVYSDHLTHYDANYEDLLQLLNSTTHVSLHKERAMVLNKNIKWAVGIVAAVIVVAAVVLYPKLVVTLPNDGADAKLITFKNTYGHRYTEMFLIGGNAITKNLEANVYNTWGLNGSDTSGDSCPAALLDKIDIKAITIKLADGYATDHSRWFMDSAASKALAIIVT